MSHEQEILSAFNRACEVLNMRGFAFRPMHGRVEPVKNTKHRYTLGAINLKTKTITIDIYTAKRRKPKKVSAILAVLAHELAHYQKPPYRQRYRGRVINRMHYRTFYKQVKRNIGKFKKDKFLGGYFSPSK